MGWAAPAPFIAICDVEGPPAPSRSLLVKEIATIGIDLAKNVFQVHALDASGEVVLRRKLRRSQVLAFFSTLKPALIGMEACAGAHFWARELCALGHEARLMPAAYVKPYVKPARRMPPMPRPSAMPSGGLRCASFQ